LKDIIFCITIFDKIFRGFFKNKSLTKIGRHVPHRVQPPGPWVTRSPTGTSTSMTSRPSICRKL